MPIVSIENKWSTTDSAMVLSAFFWGYIMTQFISGYISDKYGGLKIMWIAAVGWSSSTFIIPNAIELLSSRSTKQCVNIVAITRTINGAFQGSNYHY